MWVIEIHVNICGKIPKYAKQKAVKAEKDLGIYY